jgi:acyl-CoA thioester hydrolase
VAAPFRTKKRVEFGDTDMAGIVHFSNFFRYMEIAETDFLHARGLSVSGEMAGEKMGFPRVSVSCDYKRPARFEDILEIEVTVEEVGRKSVQYRFDFYCNDKEIATGRMTAVCCRHNAEKKLESFEIPQEIRDKLAQ